MNPLFRHILVHLKKKIIFKDQVPIMTPGVYLTPRHDWQDLCRAPNDIMHIKYTSFVSCGLQRRRVFMYFPNKSMMVNDMPGAGLYGPQGHRWQDL